MRYKSFTLSHQKELLRFLFIFICILLFVLAAITFISSKPASAGSPFNTEITDDPSPYETDINSPPPTPDYAAPPPDLYIRITSPQNGATIYAEP